MNPASTIKNTSQLSLVFIVLFLLGSAGCSSLSKIEDKDRHFHTRITSGGLKHFQLSLIQAPQRERAQPHQQSNNSRNKDPVESQAKKTEKLLIALAELTIAENGFCQEGYWFLGNNFYGRKPYIRGECNDTASEEDRENFPDTLLYW